MSETAASHEGLLPIGEVADRAALRPSALRYYEQVGLLAPSARIGGRRYYEPAVLGRLAVIALLQQSGFTLAEVVDILGRPAADGQGAADRAQMAARWRAMAQRKLDELDAHIARAEAARRLLEEALRCGCCAVDGCALVDRARATRSRSADAAAPFGHRRAGTRQL